MILAHCLGGSVVGMNLLLDAETGKSVHAVAFSQFAFFGDQSPTSGLKTMLHLSNDLKLDGVKGLDPSNAHKRRLRVRQKFIDSRAAVVGRNDHHDFVEQCSSECCQMISFMVYGLLYEHRQLNRQS